MDIPIIDGRPLSDEDKAVLQRIYDAANEVIDLVREGKLELYSSYVLPAKRELYLAQEGGRYVVVSPGQGVYVIGDDNVAKKYQGRLDQIENWTQQINEWINLAT